MVIESSKKACAAVLAFATAVTALSAMPKSIASAEEVKYEFENGTITGTSTEVVSEIAGFSGDGYVFLKDGGDTITVEVEAPATGMYDINIAYHLPPDFGDSKIQNILINDVTQGQVGFTANDSFSEIGVGTYKLNEGKNTVTIHSSWGWTMFDYLTIKEATLPELSVAPTLSDPEATDSTKRLMNYLSDVYGKNILSGQQEIYMYGPHDFEYEFNYIEDLTGELPAIRAFDYLNECNILYGSQDGTTDRMIDWVENKGGIITASWHVTVPKDFASYEHGVTKVDWSAATYDPKLTDFDTAKVLEVGSKENIYYMDCLESLATSIKKLQDKDIPIILRPLHEAEGGGGETGSWFWWGKSGSAVYKDLWKLTYDTLTKDYGLHNIIWEWNSYTYETSTNWYPGDEYVDLVAYDKYNCTDWSTGSAVLVHNDSAISGTFYSLVKQYDGKKMVAMSENDSVPTLQNLVDEKAGWLYFCPWYDGGQDNINFLSNPIFNKAEDLKELYQSDYCITLDELPDLKTYPIDDSDENPDVTDEPDVTTTVGGDVTTDSSDTDVTTTDVVSDTTKGSDSEPDVTTTASSDDITDGTTTTGVVTPDMTLLGDADCSGTVDLLDLTIANQHVVKISLLEGTGYANADVIADGTVDISDLTQIKKYLIKLIDKF